MSTEAYPYGSGATAIGATFLAPERLRERRLTPRSLTYMPTGERVADEARLRELRATDPGALVIIEMLREDDPAELAFLRRSFDLEGTIVASDSIPLMPTLAGFDPRQWPLARGSSPIPALPAVSPCFTGGGKRAGHWLTRCAVAPFFPLESWKRVARR